MKPVAGIILLAGAIVHLVPILPPSYGHLAMGSIAAVGRTAAGAWCGYLSPAGAAVGAGAGR